MSNQHRLSRRSLLKAGALAASTAHFLGSGLVGSASAGSRSDRWRTRIRTGDGTFDGFCDRLQQTVRSNRSVHSLEGQRVVLCPTWIRDHIHTLKGFKYQEKDLASGLDFFIDRQHEEGYFYEMVIGIDNPHTTFVDDKYVMRNEEDGVAYVRLELEADIEYLMVEGVYTVWQATGRDEWMREKLPALERGLRYMMTHPKRWSETHGLVKRPVTIDTWDFAWGQPDTDRRIRPRTPMAIMHGDNTGMFEACRLLADMYRHTGEAKKARHWTRQAERIRRNLNEAAWNGRFYTHLVHLDLPGGDEEWKKMVADAPEDRRISLSNAYALNRGICTQGQASAIIESYRRMRDENPAGAFAEWFAIYPPYDHFPNEKFGHYDAGRYINGGIASFLAGELARGAFRYGFEDYGWDVISRLQDLYGKNGSVAFLYDWNGNDQGGGPAGWGSSAILNAVVEGLAGVEDRATLYRDVRLSPAWCATPHDEVEVSVGYAPSDASVSYTYRHDPGANTISLAVTAPCDRLELAVLVPRGAKAVRMLHEREKVVFRRERVRDSEYAVAELRKDEGGFRSDRFRILYTGA